MNSSEFLKSLNLPCGEPGFATCHAATWIWKIIPFILLPFGTLGNMLSLIIFARKRLKETSTTVYLGCLAVVDLIALWTGVLKHNTLWVKELDMSLQSQLYCKVLNWLCFAAWVGSIWLLVLLTKERVIFIVFPLFAKRKLTRRYAIISAATVCTVSLLLNSHHFWMSVELATVGSNNTTSMIKVCGPSTGAYTHFMSEFWIYVGPMVNTIVPLVLIIAGNGTLFLCLLQKRRQAKASGIRQTNVFKSVTKVLFCLSGVCVLSMAPAFLVSFMYRNKYASLTGQNLALFKLLTAISKSLLLTNYTFNFFLYCWSGSTFRSEVFSFMLDMKVYFSKCCRRRIVQTNVER